MDAGNLVKTSKGLGGTVAILLIQSFHVYSVLEIGLGQWVVDFGYVV